MRIPFLTDRFESGAPRPRLIIGLLVLVLLLVLGLAWQALQTLSTHDETAKGVLRDYARLAIDEYARRAMGSVGYYGYYTIVNELRTNAQQNADFPNGLPAPEPGSQAEKARTLVAALLRVDLQAARVESTATPDPTVHDYVLGRSREFAAQPAPESGFLIDHALLEGVETTFVLFQLKDKNTVFGFEVDRAMLRERLRAVVEDGPLLPKSLSDGMVGNQFLYLRHGAATSEPLFETGPAPSPYLLAQRELQDEYGGIFRSHVIAAALDTTIADSVIIGGMPRSRLPALFALILLTTGLLIATIRQLRREYAVMQLRNNFVAEVSHELRTPLTQIRMFTETLLLDRLRSDDDKRRALTIINRESRRLIHLVENVLRFSRTDDDQRELELTAQPLAPLVEAIVDEFRPLAEGADMHLKLAAESDASAAVNDHALRQILLNLLDNAVKYGPPGQNIAVAVTSDAGRVTLSVSDEGPGIARKHRADIWSPYHRLARERTSAIAGAGIGLAVVRDLVQRLGGQVRVEDAGEVGARFVIELPATAPENVAP